MTKECCIWFVISTGDQASDGLVKQCPECKTKHRARITVRDGIKYLKWEPMERDN